MPTPPADDEAEFSAFGPGYGECLLVHLGLGEWMIVDSCTNRRGDLPALDYLDRMGVPDTAVRLVVATHWHDDHVRGLARVMERCTEAKFVASIALKHDEFIAAFGRQDAARFGKLTSGVDEFATVFKHLKRANQRSRLMWAIQNEVIHQRNGEVACRVVALAPCHTAVSDTHEQLASLVEPALEPVAPRRVGKPTRNDAAVVLRVEVADATMLLGADLQETDDTETGWTAVITCCRDLNLDPSEIFKVPHHGSRNAHQPQVWDHLLVHQPEAVVCPHRKGANHLPGGEELSRLCHLANVHLTADAVPPSASISYGRLKRPGVAPFGRVTLRRRGADPDWRVSYQPPARSGCPPDLYVGA